jgi:RNA polymerase-binding protein DksA
MARKLDVDKFKKLLQDERSRLVRERHIAMQDDMESGLELSDYDNHPADAASETFERTKDHALDENFKDIIEGIDEALRKMEGGTYGTCDRCGDSINVERLKAIPYATLCIDCQETVERR